MISSAAVVLIAVAVVASPVLVSSMPEHAKRYRNNVNDISQHHALSRSGKPRADELSQMCLSMFLLLRIGRKVMVHTGLVSKMSTGYGRMGRKARMGQSEGEFISGVTFI